MIAASVLWTALLELEASSVGILLLSRPMVLGAGLGWALRQPAEGWRMGALVELLTLEHLPMGSRAVPNAAIAAGTAVLLVLPLGGPPPAAALPAGLALGAAYPFLETRLKAWKGRLAARAQERVERGDAPSLWSAVAASLALEWAMAAAVLFLAAAVLKPALAASWEAAPECVRRGLTVAYGFAPGLGLACLAQAFILRGWGRTE